MTSILVCNYNADYMNPNVSLVNKLLAKLGDTTFYGPGFQSTDVLQKGLKNFLKFKSYDLIFILPVPADFTDDEIHNSSGFIKYSFYCKFSKRDCEYFLMDMRSFDYSIPYIVILNYNDAHSINLKRISQIVKKSLFCMTLYGKEMLNENVAKNLPNYPTDYLLLVRKFKHKIFPCFFFVDDKEIIVGQKKRGYTWSVFGTKYPHRAKARKVLKHSSIYDYFRIKTRLVFILSRIIGRNKKIIFKILNKLQDHALLNSQISYTCGHYYEQLVRKHLEIPSKGTVLVTNKVEGIENLGFEDGVSFIQSCPENLPNINSDFLKNSEKFTNIGLQGQKVVKNCHTITVRSLQLKKAMELAVNSQYYGSYWQNGKMVHRTELVKP